MRRPPNNYLLCALVVVATTLVGGALFSATIQGAEIMLVAYGESVRSYIGVYPIVGMVGGALLAAWCGTCITTAKGLRKNVFILFSIIASSVGAFAVFYPGGILVEYHLSSWNFMPSASALTVCSGIALGVYYGLYGMPYKMPRNKFVLILFMVVSFLVHAYAQYAINGAPEEYQFAWHLAAVGAVVATSVLAAMFGAMYATSKRPNQRHRIPEIIWWSLLFVPNLSIAILSVEYGLFMDNGAMLQHMVFGASPVMIVAATALSSCFNSLNPGRVVKSWFGYLTLVLVYVLSFVGVVASHLFETAHSDIVLAITRALIPSLMGVFSALLGTHVAIRLKMQFGVDRRAAISYGEYEIAAGNGWRLKENSKNCHEYPTRQLLVFAMVLMKPRAGLDVCGVALPAVFLQSTCVAYDGTLY